MKLFAPGYPDEGNFGVLFYSTSWKKWEHFHSVYATLNCKHLFSTQAQTMSILLNAVFF